MLGTSDKILVTGSTGLVGGGIHRRLLELGYTNVLAPSRHMLDLTKAKSVDLYFQEHRPDYVFLAGARVGGIKANSEDLLGFYNDNMVMQLHAFEACKKWRVEKVMFLGSSCIYPRECPQPMKEEAFLSGQFEPTNEGYALAKVAGVIAARMHSEQTDTQFICPIPCNVYGTGDHFDFDRAHVLSALVRRFVDAHDEGLPSVTLWGTGVARREFIHIDDLAEILVQLMITHEDPSPINVGTGEDLSIKSLAQLIKTHVGYQGEIKWDDSMPDGMPRKCMDVSKLFSSTTWRPQVDLINGVVRMIDEYRDRRDKGTL